MIEIELRPPLRDVQEESPVYRCPKCGGEVYAGETLFEWSGKRVCVDCFKRNVSLWLEMSPEQVANAMGFDFYRMNGGSYGYRF